MISPAVRARAKHVKTTQHESGTNNQIASFAGFFPLPQGAPSAILHLVTGVDLDRSVLQTYILEQNVGGEYLGYEPLAQGQGLNDFLITSTQLANYRDAATGETLLHVRMFRPPLSSGDPNASEVTWSTDQFVVYPAPSNGPALPTGLSASPDANGGIDLAWTDNANNETGYVVERKGGADAGFVQVGTAGADAMDYQDTSVSASTTYTYRVRATNGNGDSPNSNEASATTQVDSNAVVARTTAAATGPNKIVVYWTGVAGATGYNVYRSTTSGSGYVKLNPSPVAMSDPGPGVTNGFVYADTTLASGTEYFYIVKPVFSGGTEGSAGLESSDVPNSAAIPWDTMDATQIFSKADSTSPGGWIAGAQGDIYGPNGVGYQRTLPGSVPRMVGADGTGSVDEDIYFGGESTTFGGILDYVPGNQQASNESGYPATTPPSGAFRKVISQNGFYQLSATVALPATRSLVIDRQKAGAAKDSDDTANIYSGGIFGQYTMDAGFRCGSSTNPGWSPTIFISGPDPTKNGKLGSRFFAPLLGEDKDGHHRVFASGVVRIRFDLPAYESGAQVAVFTADARNTGHIAYFEPTGNPQNYWHEFDAGDPTYGAKDFIQVMTWPQGFRKTQSSKFQVKRVDSIAQVLKGLNSQNKLVHTDFPEPTPGLGLLQTNSYLPAVGWSNVKVNLGLDFDYFAVAKAGWYPFGPGYIQVHTDNPWFTDITSYVRMRR